MCFHTRQQLLVEVLPQRSHQNSHTIQHLLQLEQAALQLCHHTVSLLDLHHHIHHLAAPLLRDHMEPLHLPGLQQRCAELHVETGRDGGTGLVAEPCL
jgi:hypothetical protein